MARKPAEPWYHAPPTEEVCPLCGRPIPASQRDLHHWVPKTKGGKEVAALHRICHRQLHALFTETELAQRYSTVDALLADEAVRAFVRWVRTKPIIFTSEAAAARGKAEGQTEEKVETRERFARPAARRGDLKPVADSLADHPVDQYSSRCQGPQPASEDLKRI